MAAALPQVSYTMTGMLTGDPFLSYRVASNHLLGIVLVAGAAGSFRGIGRLSWAPWSRIDHSDRLAVVVASTALVVMPFLAVKRRVGERMRSPTASGSKASCSGELPRASCSARLVGVMRPAARGRAAGREGAVGASRRPASIVLAATIVASAMLWAAALPRLGQLPARRPCKRRGTPTSRETAIETLARAASSGPAEGLITTERCIDNRTDEGQLRLARRQLPPRYGVARERDAIDAIIEARDDERLDIDAMRRERHQMGPDGLQLLIELGQRVQGQLQRVDSRDYRIADDEVISDGSQTDGRITLWRLDDEPPGRVRSTPSRCAAHPSIGDGSPTGSAAKASLERVKTRGGRSAVQTDQRVPDDT